MLDVRIDDQGDFRCWKCGGKNFDHKRTARAKVIGGVGALVTKKKLKCQSCGEYNQTGNAKPYVAQPVNSTPVAPVATGAKQTFREEMKAAGASGRAKAQIKIDAKRGRR